MDADLSHHVSMIEDKGLVWFPFIFCLFVVKCPLSICWNIKCFCWERNRKGICGVQWVFFMLDVMGRNDSNSSGCVYRIIKFIFWVNRYFSRPHCCTIAYPVCACGDLVPPASSTLNSKKKGNLFLGQLKLDSVGPLHQNLKV